MKSRRYLFISIVVFFSLILFVSDAFADYTNQIECDNNCANSHCSSKTVLNGTMWFCDSSLPPCNCFYNKCAGSVCQQGIPCPNCDSKYQIGQCTSSSQCGSSGQVNPPQTSAIGGSSSCPDDNNKWNYIDTINGQIFQNGQQLVVGDTYPITGWAYFCSGPGGKGVYQVDFHLCPPGTTTGCTYLGGTKTTIARPDTAGYCNNDPYLNKGWKFDWTVAPSLLGTRTFISAAINDAAVTCTKWAQREVNIVTATPIPDPCPKKSMGDANCDKAINESDYVIWKGEYRTGFIKSADFDKNGVVDLVDFEIWRRNI